MKVRLVEDNDDLTMLIKHMLEPEVELVITSRDFEQLLTREPWHGIDTALVDILLGEPDIDGRDILRWLKEERPDIRRVCFSAVANVYPELAALADVVLTKGSVGSAALLFAVGVRD